MSNSEIDSLSESTNSFMPGGSCFGDIFYDHPYVVSMCACSTMEKWQLYMQKAQENIDNKVYLKKKSFILKKRENILHLFKEKKSHEKKGSMYVPFVPTLIFQKVTCACLIYIAEKLSFIHKNDFERSCKSRYLSCSTFSCNM